MTPYRTPPSARAATLDSADDARTAVVLLAFFVCAVVVAMWPGVPNDTSEPHAGRATVWHRAEGAAGHGGAGHR